MVTQGEEPVEEPHGHVLDVDSIFGVRIVRDADPSVHALQLAHEVGGEIVRDLEHAERAFASRADAGRAEPVVLKDRERAELEARANATNEDPAVTESAISQLQQLAGELAMTERIRSDTEAEFTGRLSRRLSATSAVAIHPSAIRQAAAAVTEAEAEVAGHDVDLAVVGDRPASSVEGHEGHNRRVEETSSSDETDDGHPELFNEEALEQNRHALALSVGVAAFFVGAVLLLLLTGVPVVVPVVVLVIGLVLAGVLVRRNRVRSKVDQSAERDASGLLASNTALELAASNRPASPLAEESALPSDAEWLARRAHLETAREGATERLRSARKHWESLVGPEADPHQLDELLRVRDPQLELVGAASKTSPTVRTVSAVHRRTLARWRVAWATAGYDEPPELDAIDTHLERLGATGREAAEAARERLLAAQTWSDACATIDRPILLVEPEEWLPKETLETLLGSLPAGAEVIIVEPQAAGPEGSDVESD